MKFVAISDTHSRHYNLKLPRGDVLLHAGDLSYKGKRTEIIDFLNWFSKQNFPHKIFIAGNHDFYLEKESATEIQKIIPQGVIYLNDSGTTINNLHIWGSPFTPWFFNWAFNRHRGAPINKHWNLIPDNTDILITHGPPYGIHDTIVNEQHVGCKDLLKRIQLIKPKVHIYGHIHEAHGMQKHNGTVFINASVLNESYEISHRPIVFDL